MSNNQPDVLQREPVYSQIAGIIRKEVKAGLKAGDKYQSQNELAKRFKVTAVTARKAVDLLVDEGLLERKLGSGTYVTEPSATKAVGILIEQDITLPNTSVYWLGLTQHLKEILEEAGCLARFYMGRSRSGGTTPERPQIPEFWHDLENEQLCGLAIVGTDIRESWLNEVRRHNIPVVAASLYPELLPNHMEPMIRAGTEFLIRDGRKNLAVIDWGSREQPGKNSCAFANAVRNAGLELVDEWCFFAGPQGRNRMAGQQGVEQIWHAFPDRQPDGLLLCYDDFLNTAEMAIKMRGIRVPDDLILVSHVNRGMDIMFEDIPLVKMEVDARQHARALAEVLLDFLADRTPSLNPDISWFEIVDSTSSS